MKAITFSTYGDPDVLRLRELPDPQPDPGQVRVRIKTAGVQPVDCAVRSGWFANRSNSFQDEFPVILGNEFAGVIDMAGEEVEQFAEGDEVAGWQTLACYAGYVVVPADQIIHKPGNMSWEVAGGLSGAGQTAHTALEELGITEGDTVLIHAAAGRGALEASVELIENKGRIGTLVDFELAPKLGVKSIRSKRGTERLKELAKLYTTGKLKIYIRSSYPLHQAADAHRDVETGHGWGKVVLKIS